jgi:acetolactate synthase-1/2/3 large subunit
MVLRIADYIMQRLTQAGVTHVFQVTGRGALFLSDALAKSNTLKAVSLHHEQSCAFAAVANAEKSRGLGACLVSTGCASTNTMTGVLTAWQDGIPCFFISGQNILRETTRHTGIALRTYGQQEADIVELVTPITKFAHMLTSPQEINEVMDRAIHAAMTGRKGPVWLDVPLDLQSALIDPSTLAHALLEYVTNPSATAADVERIAKDLRQ